MNAFWSGYYVLGIVSCAVVGYMVMERVKKDQYFDGFIFVALCGFAVFPVLNYVVAFVALAMLQKEKP